MDHRAPANPQGLPEPVARKAGTAGSEGPPAQQCAGATRPDECFCAIITRQAIRRGAFTSVDDLLATIEAWIDG